MPQSGGLAGIHLRIAQGQFRFIRTFGKTAKTMDQVSQQTLPVFLRKPICLFLNSGQFNHGNSVYEMATLASSHRRRHGIRKETTVPQGW